MLNFGQAVEALKQGKRVCRVGWNDKGMWLRLVQPGTEELDDAICSGESNTYSFTVLGSDQSYNDWDEALPWIGMRTADRKFVPWLASQTDVLAEDWQVVE